jgi:hypothetical protein
MIDDGHYCPRICCDFAYGKGFAFGGLTATNGFQPLWLLAFVVFYVLNGNKLVIAQSVTIAQVLVFGALVSPLSPSLSHSRSWEIVAVLNCVGPASCLNLDRSFHTFGHIASRFFPKDSSSSFTSDRESAVMIGQSIRRLKIAENFDHLTRPLRGSQVSYIQPLSPTRSGRKGYANI